MIAKTERNKQANAALAFWELADPARWFTHNKCVRCQFSKAFQPSAFRHCARSIRAVDDACQIGTICRESVVQPERNSHWSARFGVQRCSVSSSRAQYFATPLSTSSDHASMPPVTL